MEDGKVGAAASEDDASGGEARWGGGRPSFSAASGEDLGVAVPYASGAVSDSSTPSALHSSRKRGGEAGAADRAAAPSGGPPRDLDEVDAAFATRERGRWRRRATRLVRMWRVSGFSDAGDERGQAERSAVVQPGDLITAVNGQTLLDPWLNWEDAIFRCGR